jgi:protein TonB
LNRFVYTIPAAVLLHGALAFAIMHAPAPLPRHARFVQVDVHRRLPPPTKLPEPKPEPPPPPPPVVHHKRPKPPEVVKAPIPNQETKPPPEPPKQPPVKLFGLTESSFGNGDMVVAQGNTTIADPTKIGRKDQVQPLPAAPPGAAPAPVFKAASPIEIRDYPVLEDEDPFRNAQYTDEARQLEIEGETVVRVEVDEHGKVHGVKVIKGLGHGLDDIVVKKFRSGQVKMRPAYSTAGKAVASYFTYTVSWQLSR